MTPTICMPKAFSSSPIARRFAHRRPVNAGAAGDDYIRLERRAAQEMVDAGGERLDPFQLRRTGEHIVTDFDAEHDHHLDTRQVAGDRSGVLEQGELQRGKFRLQPVAIHLGVDVDDEDFCGHEVKAGEVGSVFREAEILCRIVEGDVRAHLVRERRVIEKFAGFLGGFEWVIGGEHHMFVAERCDRAA